jgi:branched-chain amino acid transport system permease protein
VLLIPHLHPPRAAVGPSVVLLALLIVRPWGLFGTREELDRV